MTAARVDPTTLTDAQLVDAYRAGDRDALGYLFARYRSEIRGAASRMTGSLDLDDIVGDVALRLVTSVDTWDGRASFRSWLWRVVRSAVYDRGRRTNARAATDTAAVAAGTVASVVPDPGVSGGQGDVASAAYGDPHDLIDDACDAIDAQRSVRSGPVRDALRTLPIRQQTVVLLADLAGCDYPYIAARLGIPTGTAKSRHSRGRIALRAALTPLPTPRPAPEGDHA